MLVTVTEHYPQDWLQAELGPASVEERRLLAAVLPVQQAAPSSTKWDGAAKVLAAILGRTDEDDVTGGVGSVDLAHWHKHRHNRTTQRGFRKVEVSVFVADDANVVPAVVDDYVLAIQDRTADVQAAVIVVRRAGAQASIAMQEAAQDARVVATVGLEGTQPLESLQRLAPRAKLTEVALPDLQTEEVETAVLIRRRQELDHIDLGIERGWVFLQGDESSYANIEGSSYHFLRQTRAARDQVQAGDWVLCLRTADSKQSDRGALFALARVGRLHKKGDERYAVYDRFWRAPVPLRFDDLGGDPRPTPQNPIAAVDASFVSRWAELAGLRSLEDMTIPPMALALATLRAQCEDLVLAEGTLEACLAALRSGKHLLLTGPPGTGKSSLAIALGKAAAADGLADDPIVTTGTADWTSVETVGAYRQEKESAALEFVAGHFLQAIDRDAWLVVDELNRADIDKAVGQLFSVLSGHSVELPFRDADDRTLSVVPPGAVTPSDSAAYKLSPHWRLIATMNERDRDLLFSLSEAFMRRFAVVRVAPPQTRTAWDMALTRGGVTDAQVRAMAVQIALVPGIEVGPAVMQDCGRFVMHRLAVAYETETAAGMVSAMREAVRLLLEPQLAGLFEEDRREVLAAVEAVLAAPTVTAAAPKAQEDEDTAPTSEPIDEHVEA